MDGKFLATGPERLWLRGVTYGTFAPDALGLRFGEPGRVREDFAQMEANGINAVRTYTAPPRWLLDAARDHGLRVLAGLAWEQHVAFLDDRRRAGRIEASVRDQAAQCAGHPALLGFAVGNEIPTPIVRWLGRRPVERFLERLVEGVRAEDPGALVTYVNYPSTEYLRLPFLDFLAFNLYLDEGPQVARYLARLQNLAGEMPLVLAELGADSRRAGLDAQAATIASEVETAFAAGCAGTFVFAWTDEWHRGDDAVEDWDFGLTDRDRRRKPALPALRRAYDAVGRVTVPSPSVSVVVCTHNGAATLAECLDGIAALRYPASETIVVDDGSTDRSAEIAAGFDVRLISTPNQGLSAARNVGLEAARGEIVAYIDDDARPDPDWLRFLAIAFASTSHAAIGGPNLPPPDDGDVAACVANAPGGPVHVLVSDTEAEHLPGCNMAYRREALLAIGGFDPRFRVAGDDVDLCWRLQDDGQTLGFHPAAVVWHRRRASVRAYWRQQRGYGHAEAMLERKWPERYTQRGHPTWRGRLYDRASLRPSRPSRIYHGVWGTGAFQPEEPGSHDRLSDVVRAPEWYLVLGLLAAVSALSPLWPPLLAALPALAAGIGGSLWSAALAGAGAELASHGGGLRLRLLTALLHLLQPAARLAGRASRGLVPWRRRRIAGVAVPRRRQHDVWSECWVHPASRVARVESAVRRAGGRVLRGSPYVAWDLEISGGSLGAVRVLTAVEDHGRGRQLVRTRIWPAIGTGARRLLISGAVVLVLAVALGDLLLGAAAVAATLTVLLAAAWECGTALAGAEAALGWAAHDDASEVRPLVRGRASSVGGEAGREAA